MHNHDAHHHHHGHSHDHSHSHGHAGHHHHHVNPGEVPTGAFIAGIALNGAYVVAQVIAGFMTHSMALLSDAGHNLGDVASLALSLIAFRLTKIKPTDSFTYGYKKTTILAALVNAVILLITIGVLGYGSIVRLMHPQPVEGGMTAIVAGIGIVVNLTSAMLFFRSKEHDLNTRSAFLHLLTDALVSLGVVVSGLIIKFTGWNWLDPAVSLAVLATILLGTWSLLTDSLRMSLDAVPANVDKGDIQGIIARVNGVEEIHHMHIWAMSTTHTALTTHLVVNDKLSFDEKMKVVHEVKHQLQHHNIQHATIELESAAMPCHDEEC